LGDGAAAREAAEIFDEYHNDDDAAHWWYQAAALGDVDAIEYVEMYRP
jgi:hypothetical protein